MGIKRPRPSSTNQGLDGKAPLSSVSWWGGSPSPPQGGVGARHSGVSQTEAAAGMPPAPAAPAKSALPLPFQAKKDQPDPRVAGLGAWIETSARRLALPCGGKRFSAVPAWVSHAEPLLVTFRNCQAGPHAHGAFPPSPIQVAASGDCDSGAPGPKRPGGKSWLPFMGFDSRAGKWLGHRVALTKGSSCVFT